MNMNDDFKPRADRSFALSGARRRPSRVHAIGLAALSLALLLAAGLFSDEPAVRSSEPEAGVPQANGTFDSQVLPFLEKHCLRCHQGDEAEADLRLIELSRNLAAGESFLQWEKVLDRIEREEMPPFGEPRPAKREIEAIGGWIRPNLAEGEKTRGDRGGSVIRRLNRTEYENTVRDLFGIRYEAGDIFPEENTAHGFDTVASALTISPLLLEKYLAVAEAVTDLAIVTEERPKTAQRAFAADSLVPKRCRNPDGTATFFVERWRYPPRVNLGSKFPATARGDYVIRVKVHAIGSLVEPSFTHHSVFKPEHLEDIPEGYEVPRMSVFRSGRLEQRVDVSAREPAWHEIRLYAEPGDTFELGFDNGVENVSPKMRDAYTGPGLVFHEVDVEGPVIEQWPPESHQRIYFKGPGADDTREYAREILERLAPRIYRRPAEPAEIDRLLAAYDSRRESGESFEDSVAVAIQVALCSPSFLYLAEPSASDEEGGPRRLNDHELASRLSYFLWRSMPDEVLFELARERKLAGDPQVLDAQVRRMLADPKAAALTRNFANQWLNLGDLAAVAVDGRMYPEYDDYLRHLFERETELFFEEILRHDLSLLNFIDSDFAMLNDRLADHYGIDGVSGSHFRRVALPEGSHRGGLLGQGSILTLTTCGTRTSPVLRGAWVLEKMLGEEPPPPPKDVPNLDIDLRSVQTTRERFELHRQDKSCAVCHVRIDPPGFALEAYDVIGAWRTHERRGRLGNIQSDPVDPSGTLVGGESFDGPDEFRRILRTRHQDRFVHSFAEKMLIYALGRGLNVSDRPTVKKLIARLEENDHTMSGLILDIVRADAFQTK